MEWLHYIATPLVGGFIGLITNGIAIKMLFRPHYPVKIGNFKLPFTPGLIPKEKPRIAKAIGQVVGANLLDTDTLQKALLSDTIQESIYKKVDTVIDQMGCEEGNLYEYLERKGLAETSDLAVSKIGGSVSEYLSNYIVEQQLSNQVLQYAVDKMMEHLNPMILMMAEPAIEKAKPAILEKMNEIILEECPHMVNGYIGENYANWMEKPMKDVAIWLWPKKDMIKEKLWEVYVALVEKQSARFIQRLNVSEIVENKINEFDVAYLEELIMEISRKELNALVWMGGLLGIIIGTINLFI